MKKTESFESRRDRTTALLCAFAVALLALSLVPMLLIAQYDLPLGDDVIYGGSVAQALQESPSVGTALSAAADVVAAKYESWQGTFFAIFLMALQPGVFGNAFYRITPYLMLGALIASTLLLTHTLVCSVLGMKRRVWLLLGAALCFFSIQLCVSPREGFYWYNGAVYYTLFHSLLLVLATLILRMFFTKRAWARAVFAALGVLISAVISGGNYATAMVCFELLVLAIVYAAVHKERELTLALALMLLVFGAGMAVSMLAPGNAVRQADVIASGYTPSGPLKAIVLSLALGAVMAAGWFDIACVAIILIVAVLIGPALRRTQWRFRYPLLVVALLFGVFASQFTPSVYAASSPGPYRLRNVAYFVYLLLVALSAAYVTGWAQRRYDERDRGPRQPSAALRWLATYPLLALLCTALLFGASLAKRDVFSTPSVLAVTELRDGTAEEHAKARLRELAGETQQEPAASESKLLS